MSMLDPKQPPPPDYYASRVRKLLDGVERQYSDVLDQPERAVVERIAALSEDGLRLLARLWSRTGPVFRVDTLAYREVGDMALALADLESAGLIAMNAGCAADRVLARLTRAELDELFGRRGGVLKAARITEICGRYPEPLIRARIAARFPWCTLACANVFATFSLLFFGGRTHDLATFVLEDLGVVRYEPYPVDRHTRQFDTRADLRRYLELADLRSWLHRLEAAWQSPAAHYLLEALWQPERSRTLEQRRGRILNHLGRAAERAKDFDVALSAYARAEVPPARERTVRVLKRLGDDTSVQHWLAAIASRPLAATERVFADGYTRRSPRLIEDRLELPCAPACAVEAAALERLLAGDSVGRHMENRLPLGMLGLAFWREIFTPIPGTFVNAYQAAPLDLYWPDFRAARAEPIAARLSEIRCARRLRASVLETWRERQGVASALVNWSAFDIELIERLIRDVPARDWVLLFDYMLDDLAQTRTGFPDLVVLHGPGRYEFVEVKGPGDQIRPEQRIWFEFFRRHDLPARVLRVTW